MEVTNKTRVQLRLQGWIFVILFLSIIGLLAWLSHRYNLEADWTATNRNTLSEASIKLAERIPDKMTITTFARDTDLIPIRRQIEELIGRYQKHTDKIDLKFINPETEPDKTRAMGITVEGETVIEYQGRSEHVKSPNEENITNTLQLLLRSGERKVLFISGHGERKPQGQANHDLGSFIAHLEKKGIKSETITLTETPAIPADTAVLVIAGPQIDYLPGEVKLIRDYVKQGGNLLWLMDDDRLYKLDPLADDLGIGFHPGVIVDPSTQILGIPDPTFALIADYGSHPITRNFHVLTLYPRAVGISQDKVKDEWLTSAFLQTVSRSWSETGEMKGAIRFDADSDVPGPLTVGLAMTRDIKSADTPSADEKNQDKADKDQEKKQRIVIMGDGDFLSNAFLGNQGNQDMGYAIINWLSHDDAFIDIPVATAPDSQVNLDQATWSIIGLLFLIGVPVSLVVAGVSIWVKRRKR